MGWPVAGERCPHQLRCCPAGVWLPGSSPVPRRHCSTCIVFYYVVQNRCCGTGPLLAGSGSRYPFFGSGSGSSSYKNWLTSSEKRVFFLRLNTGSVSDQKVPALTGSGSGSAALCRAKECYSFIPVLSYGPQSRIGSRFCGSGLFENVM